jgi:hypothetical protein
MIAAMGTGVGDPAVEIGAGGPVGEEVQEALAALAVVAAASSARIVRAMGASVRREGRCRVEAPAGH